MDSVKRGKSRWIPYSIVVACLILMLVWCGVRGGIIAEHHAGLGTWEHGEGQRNRDGLRASSVSHGSTPPNVDDHRELGAVEAVADDLAGSRQPMHQRIDGTVLSSDGTPIPGMVVHVVNWSERPPGQAGGRCISDEAGRCVLEWDRIAGDSIGVDAPAVTVDVEDCDGEVLRSFGRLIVSKAASRATLRIGVEDGAARIRTVDSVTKRAIGGSAMIAYVLPGGELRQWGATHGSFSEGWRLIEKPGGWLGISSECASEMRDRCEVEIAIEGYETARVVISGWNRWTEVLLTPRSAR